MKKTHILALLAASTSLFGPAARAATEIGNMAVSATVNRTCTVSADPLTFGVLNSGNATEAQATITVNCTAGSSADEPTLRLGLGVNANLTQRNMIGGESGTALVPYNLYADSARTEAVDANTAVSTGTTDSGVSYSGTIFGRVPAAPNYQLGTFSDTVVVTVSYDGSGA